jgi:hypothetical protein
MQKLAHGPSCSCEYLPFRSFCKVITHKISRFPFRSSSAVLHPSHDFYDSENALYSATKRSYIAELEHMRPSTTEQILKKGLIADWQVKSRVDVKEEMMVSHCI